MKRTKLADRVLPTYTKGEEIFNMVSHIVGGVLGIVAIVLCIIKAAINGNAIGVVGASIYGSSMILLYTMSSIYHGLSSKLKAKKIFQIIDHCSIYILIAGSYTPIVLCTIRNIDKAVCWWIFGIVWFAAAIGITLNSIDLKSTKIFSMFCYLLMGWCIVFKFDVLLKGMNFYGILFLVAGGIAYTIGALIYAIGRNKKYCHSIFHVFIVLGSLLQFFCILFYVV